MKIEIEIKPKLIADLMITVIESGDSRYWCNGVYLESHGGGRRYSFTDEDGKQSGLWYADPKLYEGDAFATPLQIAVFEDDDDSGREDDADEDAEEDRPVGKKHVIGREEIARGFTLMAEKHGEMLGRLLNEEGDATDADVWFQFVVLGEVVYG